MNTSTILLFIFLIAVILIVHIATQERAKERITLYLQGRGASNIQIKYHFFDFDRSNMTFSVTYTGITGKQQITRCKLSGALFSEREIFWSDLPDLEAIPIGLENTDGRPNYPTSASINNKLSEKLRAQSENKLPTYMISKVLPIPGSRDQIVMLAYTQSFQNVLRCQPDGKPVWLAELPTASDDAYTNISWEDEQLTAFSKSCIAVVLDVKTGKILSPQS